MQYRMIAVDLDDTLLDESSKISNRSRLVIREAIDQGIKFVIATGRMYKTSLHYMQEIDPDGDSPLINYHGALVKTAHSKKVLLHRPLSNKLAVAIAGEAESSGLNVSIFIDDTIYVDRESKVSKFYRSLTGIDINVVGSLTRFLSDNGKDPSKMSIISFDGEIEQAEKHFRKKFNGKVIALQSRPYFLEITDRLATKGQTLRWLAGQQGISREEIIAFGDGYNDLDMVRYAGLGVAVANARKEVIEAADLVTTAHNEDGVARVIEKYILNRPA